MRKRLENFTTKTKKKPDWERLEENDRDAASMSRPPLVHALIILCIGLSVVLEYRNETVKYGEVKIHKEVGGEDEMR